MSSSDQYWNPQDRYKKAFEDDTDYPELKEPSPVPHNSKIIVEMPISGDRYEINKHGQFIRLEDPGIDTSVNG